MEDKCGEHIQSSAIENEVLVWVTPRCSYSMVYDYAQS